MPTPAEPILSMTVPTAMNSRRRLISLTQSPSSPASSRTSTVWPWLIGHYVDARQKHDGDATGARHLLGAFEDHLRDAGVGSISEIFDAEAPYLPRGCIAQAWSVAEVLRAWLATAAPAERGRADAPVTAEQA